MTTTFAQVGPADRPARSASFLGRIGREYGYVAGSLFTGILGFCWSVTLFAAGLGTLPTMLGMPVLALLLSGCRGLAALERARVGALLGEELPAPAPVRRSRAGFWGAAVDRLADGAGWRAFAHELLMFPWRVFSFVLSTVLYAVGLAMAALPAYNWVFKTYVGWPGYRIFDYYDSHHVHHTYYVSSSWQLIGASLAGVLVLLLAVGTTRVLTGVSRSAARLLAAG
ncbi:sensor domain-containing protein [Kitasatospora viridis]|uniref:Putative sensor protein n=1 Tax=Kitasatospora viridis TaxID=281105 RepID=A0A561UGN7_9ACTN|nr:sensor domain-containing protein [Kitasatospora viridis]TWF98529.1 putative sensor protein [Kitasatospora viridis]